MLKPRDVLVTLALVDAEPAERGYARLAQRLGMSASEAHAAVDRAVTSGVVERTTCSVCRAALKEFLVHGLRYVLSPGWTGLTRGVPTSYAAPPLRDHSADEQLPPVWPYPEGTSRGQGLAPLYRSAPAAALREPRLYEWLALVDASARVERASASWPRPR